MGWINELSNERMYVLPKASFFVNETTRKKKEHAEERKRENKLVMIVVISLFIGAIPTQTKHI